MKELKKIYEYTFKGSDTLIIILENLHKSHQLKVIECNTLQESKQKDRLLNQIKKLEIEISIIRQLISIKKDIEFINNKELV